jgi:carbon storage regulator CsrA
MESRVKWVDRFGTRDEAGFLENGSSPYRKDIAEQYGSLWNKIQAFGELLRGPGSSDGTDRRGVAGRSIHMSLNRATGPNNGGSVMLILSRKNYESVVVGDPNEPIEQTLRVTVLEICRDKMRLGFEGAKNIPVNRCEVWRKIRSSALRKARLAGRTASVSRTNTIEHKAKS